MAASRPHPGQPGPQPLIRSAPPLRAGHGAGGGCLCVGVWHFARRPVLDVHPGYVLLQCERVLPFYGRTVFCVGIDRLVYPGPEPRAALEAFAAGSIERGAYPRAEHGGIRQDLAGLRGPCPQRWCLSTWYVPGTLHLPQALALSVQVKQLRV